MTRSRRTASLSLSLLATVLLALTACRSTPSVGKIDLRALGTSARALEHGLSHGCYGVDASTSSFWFSDIALEDLPVAPGAALPDAVFLHAQLLWLPQPGRTPLSDEATNVVVRIAIVSKGEVGVYGGAAFAEVDGSLGTEEVTIALRGGTLKLIESTAGFVDPLSPAGLTASLTAQPAPDRALAWKRAVAQIVTNATGRSTWVRALPVDDETGTVGRQFVSR